MVQKTEEEFNPNIRYESTGNVPARRMHLSQPEKTLGEKMPPAWYGQAIVLNHSLPTATRRGRNSRRSCRYGVLFLWLRLDPDGPIPLCRHEFLQTFGCHADAIRRPASPRPAWRPGSPLRRPASRP